MSALIDVYRQVAHTTSSSGRRVASWPSDAYRDDPVGFAINELGRVPTRAQAEVMCAVRDNRKTTTRAGRRTGKSSTIALIAAWAFATFPNALIYLGGPCMRQIDEIVYHELAGLFADQRCLQCRILHPERPGPCPHVCPLDAKVHASAQHGIRSSDGRRRVFGSAPRDAQSARGIAAPGSGLMALVDEMSGVPNEVFEVLLANARASGGRIAVFGNPACLNDAFWNTHQTGDWHRIVMSALDSPNVRLGRTVVDGLADPEWVSECREAWGEDDVRWLVDVLGEFPRRELAVLIQDVELSESFARHERFEDPAAQAEGELWFGIDPATGGGGDDSVIYARRGNVVLECQAFQGGTDSIIARLKSMIAKYRRDRAERVDVNFDESSTIGADLRDALRNEALRDSAVHWHGLNSRGNIDRNSVLYGHGYARPRDAYYGNMALRLKKDIAIAFDADLRAELLATSWQPDLENALKRLIDKRVLRKKLGRSPDRADGLAYCLFEHRLEPVSETTKEIRSKKASQDLEDDVPEQVTDPYEWESTFFTRS